MICKPLTVVGVGGIIRSILLSSTPVYATRADLRKVRFLASVFYTLRARLAEPPKGVSLSFYKFLHISCLHDSPVTAAFSTLPSVTSGNVHFGWKTVLS